MNRKNKRSTYKKYKRNTKKNKRKRGGTSNPINIPGKNNNGQILPKPGYKLMGQMMPNENKSKKASNALVKNLLLNNPPSPPNINRTQNVIKKKQENSTGKLSPLTFKKNNRYTKRKPNTKSLLSKKIKNVNNF